MLRIFRDSDIPDLCRLVRVYEDSIYADSLLIERTVPENIRILQAQQDFYNYILFFLKDNNCFIAVWTDKDSYLSALRIEPYCDGLLLSALETLPLERGKGYAKKLIGAVVEYLKGSGYKKVYSHIDKNNKKSLAAHIDCGFRKQLDYAVFIDGSVSQRSCTLSVDI